MPIFVEKYLSNLLPVKGFLNYVIFSGRQNLVREISTIYFSGTSRTMEQCQETGCHGETTGRSSTGQRSGNYP